MSNYMYIRVSTVEQNVDRQLVTARDYNISEDNIFIDKLSGKDTNRPALQALLSKLQSGDKLVVHELSRLGRNLTDLLEIGQDLVNRGVTVQFIKEGLTLDDSPTSKLMFSVFSAVAEFERAMIKQRQLEGIAAAKEAGKYLGRKPVELNQAIVDVACEKYLNKEISVYDACSMLIYTTKKGNTKKISAPTFYTLLDKYILEHDLESEYSIRKKYIK